MFFWYLRAVALTLALALLIPLAPDAHAARPHERSGWHVGISFGTAVGDFDGPAGESLEFKDGVSSHIRASHMVSSRWALGLAHAGWMYETGTLPTKQRYSMQNLLLTTTWYPGRVDGASGGLCLRLGAGLGWVGFTQVEIFEEEEQGHGDRIETSGLAMELNLSYEFRLTETVVVGLGMGINSTGLEEELKSATFVPVYMNLGWYWD